MTFPLVYVGATQARVPVGIRERLQADALRRQTLAASALSLAEGALILSTCERFEIYASRSNADAAAWISLVAREFDFSTAVLSTHLHCAKGAAVARHLFRVSAGLESRRLGERHILRQVREAYAAGLAARSLDAVLSVLGRSALHVGKLVRRETGIADAGGSIVNLALERLLPRPVARNSSDFCVVVLGTGMLAREAVARLARIGGVDVVVVSRSLDRARLLAQRCGVRAEPLHRLAPCLRAADGLLACTTAGAGFLVDRRAIGTRTRKPLQVVDLGIPRNVDPDAGAVPGVRLVHLEHLHGFARATPAAITTAEDLIERELCRVHAWYRGHRAAGDIQRASPAPAASRAERRAAHEHIARIKAQVAA